MSTINRHVWRRYGKESLSIRRCVSFSSTAVARVDCDGFRFGRSRANPLILCRARCLTRPMRSLSARASRRSQPVGQNGPTAVSNQEGLFVLSLDPGNTPLRSVHEISSRSRSPSRSAARPKRRDFHVAHRRSPPERRRQGIGGYDVLAISTATRTLTPLRDVPQSITVVSQELMPGPGNDERRRCRALRARN
jgi:hypothetical protein